jgi:Recombination endonuclease VII
MTTDRRQDRHTSRKKPQARLATCNTCSAEFVAMDGRRRRCDGCSGDDAAWARAHRASNGKRPATLTELSCSKCKETKSVTEFFCNRTTSTGYQSSCKACFRPSNDQRYRAKVWTCYRLRMNDVLTLLEQQGGVCAICKMELDSSSWRIDHDHSCEHDDKGVMSCAKCVRGLLCTGCNTFAGFLETRLHLVHTAANYLGAVLS